MGTPSFPALGCCTSSEKCQDSVEQTVAGFPWQQLCVPLLFQRILNCPETEQLIGHRFSHGMSRA